MSQIDIACKDACERHEDAKRIQHLTLSGAVLSFAVVAAAVWAAVAASARRGSARTISELISVGGLQALALAAAAVIAALVAETRKEAATDRARQFSEIAIAFSGAAALMVVAWIVWKLAAGQGLQGAKPSGWGLAAVGAFAAVSAGLLASEAWATEQAQCAADKPPLAPSEASNSVLAGLAGFANKDPRCLKHPYTTPGASDGECLLPPGLDGIDKIPMYTSWTSWKAGFGGLRPRAPTMKTEGAPWHIPGPKEPSAGGANPGAIMAGL